MNTSGGPVRYFNGEVRIEVTDVASSGFGTPWAHTRTYSNQQKIDFDRGNGWNWNPVNWPYFAQSTLAGATLTLYSSLYNLRYFDLNSGTGAYTPQFGDLSTLVHLFGPQQLQLTETDGTVVLFHDLTHADRPGGFVSMTAPGGTVLEVTQESGSLIVEIQRSVTTLGVTATESFLYDYVTTGDLAGHIQSCTVRRRAATTDPWTNINQVAYSYYGSGDNSGSLGDLRTATRQTWLDSAWDDSGTDYYRYYKTGSVKGAAHNLKYACGPEAFAKLSANVPDPFAASDSVVSLYADYYYEYDWNDRVSLERVFAGSKTIAFDYFRNPRYPAGGGSSSSSAVTTADYDVWIYKTVETQPDGSQQIVYANYAGQTMLSVLKASAASSDQWCTFVRYDSEGRQIWLAQPSAITGYDENYDDLLNYNLSTGKYQYVRDNDGKIEVTEYYTSGSSSSSGGSGSSPAGYVRAEKVQKGQLGTPILLQSWEYTSHTAGDVTVFPVSKEIEYPDDTDPNRKIETTYSYTYYSGTTQIAQKTTTLPVISTAQNGSGAANSRKEYYDTLGYMTWSMNERGFITRYVYDTRNGALTQRIDDVDTSVVSGAPAGWTTPSGGGLNLVTDFESDDQGRITQELGPTHTIDIGGVATAIRRAAWTVYDDTAHTVRTGMGYAIGTAPSYTYALINPVQIRQSDASGKPLADIVATRASTAGRLSPSDTFPQSSYVRWTTYQYTDCCLLASQRVYRLIPSSGEGVSGTNYDETNFGYDVMKRRNRVVTPGGTITDTVFDVRGQSVAVYVGTDDIGATDSDPTGGATTGNNMVLVTSNVIDGGAAGGDGNLTQQTQQVDATTGRVTAFAYDWRDRLLTTDGEIDFFEKRYYDNLSRVTKTERYDTSESGHLIARSETKFDDLGRVYQSVRYGVAPATGTVGNSLVDKTWYDQSGNVVKSLPAGANLWQKTTFDSLQRPVVVYSGYGTGSTYSDIFSVANDVILEQAENIFDAAGNGIQRTLRLRYHNSATSQTGALGSPSVTPNARVTYRAVYPDVLGRLRATADYGTNGGTALSRSATIPARSDAVLVSSQTFDSAGNRLNTTDPAGMVNRFSYDAAGRRTQVVENYLSSSSSSSSSSSGTGCSPSADANRTTNVTFTADGLLATLQALNASTGNQTTTYVYGTTLSDSEIATSFLLRSMAYPDSTGGSDQVFLEYNRQKQRTSLADQNGSVHSYDYDLLGRLTQDRVTTLAAAIDGAIRRIEAAYEVRGLISRLTSCDTATVGSGTIENEVLFSYNSFSQSIRTYQAHAGAVNTMTTPSVQIGYADGSSNTIRPTSLTYPNGRVVTYDYGADSSLSDQISRVLSLVDDDTTHLADYGYLGLAAVVQQDSPEPDLRYTLVSLIGSNDPDTGDVYAGLDRFGRVKDVRWRDVSADTDLSRVQYGYDRASNRMWRENPTDPNRHYDWLYTYDGLHRLKDGQRGTLNGTHTAISSPQFGQCWTLDETGNWGAFQQSDDGANWTLQQARAATSVNEISAINATVGEQWANPQYDANGNMTTIPRPGLNRPSWANLTTDQWSALTVDEWSQMEVAPKFEATYDAWNRLVKLTDGGDGSTVQEIQYDARGYRMVTASYANGALAESRHAYFTDQWRDIEERLGSAATPDRQFVWGGRYIDDLILRDRTVSETLDERLYALQDANWNVTGVCSAVGVVQERYEYDPYGNTTALAPDFANRDATAVSWSHTYACYCFDQSSSLFNVRNRTYHSRLATWLERDRRLTVNYYAYGAKSLTTVDPFGLALVAIDGTGTAEFIDGKYRLRRLSNGRPQSHVRNFYIDYVGTKQYWSGPTREMTGSDTPGLIQAGYNYSCNVWCTSNKQEKLDLIGWSRGGLAVIEIANLLREKGCCCKGDKAPKPLQVRFLGLYDAVDMTPFAGREVNQVPNNIDAGFSVYGSEGRNQNGRDYDWWPRVSADWAGKNRNMNTLPLNCTHGAIGGCPGHSDDRPNPYDYGRDRDASIEADMRMRKAASDAGVPIKLLAREDYGFADREADVPQAIP